MASGTTTHAQARVFPFRGITSTSHYFRLVIVLSLGVGAFLAVRSMFIPESFGRDGYFRGAAVDEIVGKEIRYMGSFTCTECHEEEVEESTLGLHYTVPCETCHGPAQGHLTMAESRTTLVVDESQKGCLACHARVAGRPAWSSQVDPATHREEVGFERDEACVDCHEAHHP